MKGLVFAFCLLSTALLGALTAGCSPPGNPIVGKWRSTARDAKTVEFFNDGTYQSDGVGGGTYRFPDNAHLILVPPQGEMFCTVKGFRLDGDTLVLTDIATRPSKNATQKLHRVND